MSRQALDFIIDSVDARSKGVSRLISTPHGESQSQRTDVDTLSEILKSGDRRLHAFLEDLPVKAFEGVNWHKFAFTEVPRWEKPKG
ncbi:hypothetical protein I302_106996 [Kwoniella bestiolae CBS 10118]|uniref:Uncharacterized protein n=1 Tax=Kwoniella bestiolae CBS 10118 TaxID=1296100 RepID=A0A1B9FZU5_9TREE|nr:hypothetical protein I302_05742 [Kwoniella bestiolae CBS 10118]OCF24283.1 hypothetical protein I302_05742 [Kwoniella bestiolae CBS 10118]